MSTGHISSTAFLVSESKARLPHVSLDCYAHLWTNTETTRLWEEFVAASCEHDALEVSLRNRFFLDQLRRYVAEEEGHGVVVNIAAGFSSYPHLLPEFCTHIEFDLPHIIAHKKAQVKHWEVSGKLPLRKVDYRSCDLLDAASHSEIAQVIKVNAGNKRSFVLLEGISYYLPAKIISSLIDQLRQVQVPGSLLAIEYWKTDIETCLGFKKLQSYFETHLGFPRQDYHLFEDNFFESIDDYRLLKRSSTTEYETEVCGESTLSRIENTLPASFCLMIREDT